MPNTDEIDLKTLAIIGNCADVKKPRDFVLIKCKTPFTITFKGVQYRIYIVAIPIPWIVSLHDESKTPQDRQTIVTNIEKLINGQDIIKTFETNPQPNTLNMRDEDIWFVLNPDGTSPNLSVLPEKALKNLRHQARNENVLNPTYGIRLLKDDYQLDDCDTYTNDLSLNGIVSVLSEMYEYFSGGHILKAIERQVIANHLAKLLAKEIDPFPDKLFDAMPDMEHYRKYQEESKEDWSTYCSSAKGHAALQEALDDSLNSNITKEDIRFICQSSKSPPPPCLSSNKPPPIILRALRYMLIGFYKKRGYDSVVDENGVRHVFRQQENTGYTDKKVKVDENGVHHRILRYKNKFYMDKANVHHRFRRWKNKNQTFREYIADKFKFKK